jgi:hypothetical protein
MRRTPLSAPLVDQLVHADPLQESAKLSAGLRDERRTRPEEVEDRILNEVHRVPDVARLVAQGPAQLLVEPGEDLGEELVAGGAVARAPVLEPGEGGVVRFSGVVCGHRVERSFVESP